MALSNKLRYLVLATGNKSELAMGYCTLYGDMCGGLSILADVYKTKVYELSRYYNNSKGSYVIPKNTLEKPPSAELKLNQKDTDSLPPYEILDPILRLYLEEGKTSEELIRLGHDAPLVKRIVKTVDRNEFKRRQAAPGLKLTKRAFGFGWRMPIVERYDQ